MSIAQLLTGRVSSKHQDIIIIIIIVYCTLFWQFCCNIVTGAVVINLCITKI